MDDTPDNRTPGLGTSETFKTTCWSVVLSAGHDPADVARQALELLCRAYWFPLYGYVRRHGHSPEDAQDLTQEFFAVFIARGAFARADRGRGRFRTYLLSSLKHFLHEEWRRANRQKRGGGVTFVPMDADTAESRYAEEARDGLSPDLLYDRRWAEALLGRVMARLRTDYDSTGRAAVYEQLQQFLWGRQAEVSYEEMGSRLGMTEGAVKVAVHRLRNRFRDLLRVEVAGTVGSPDQVELELGHLLGAFGS